MNKNTATAFASLARLPGPGGARGEVARPQFDDGHAVHSPACVEPSQPVAAAHGDDGREDQPRSAADDERVALHEIGGHALVGRLLGCEVGGCTCEPGPDFGGLTWGPAHDRRAKFSSQDAASICAIIGPAMPAPGEKRDNVVDVFMHVHTRVVELVAGSVAEALFLPGEPWPADSDRAQERALASLICSSPESIEAFIDFCMAEAAALLRPREHIVRALTDELRNRRTMTGIEVNETIARAVAAKAADAEMRRRREWRQREESARAFLADVSLARPVSAAARPPSQQVASYPVRGQRSRGLGDGAESLPESGSERTWHKWTGTSPF
jgi:hypothetical protein